MSSNIIPSPESNPPPPVQCILTRGSDQLQMKRVTVNSMNGSPALDHNTFESFLGDMDDESPPADGGRTFTQVDGMSHFVVLVLDDDLDFREAPVNVPRISLESSSSAALSNETTSVVGDSQPKPESSISIASDNPRTVVMSPKSEKPIHKCLVSAHLSITSHPLNPSTGTGSMESKQLFYYGFSTQLDSVPNQTSLMHIRPQFNDMFSKVDTFWQSFINSNRTSDLFTASGDICTDLQHNRSCSLNACQQQVVESNLPVCGSSSVYQIENPGQSVKDEGVRPSESHVCTE
ncbi:hypothetical protein FGIG_07539 [Fasciola gigantica]|uniref:Uncharacterized protein n=1 Tax=Fasciola gigantica TaxID=46835 RepID=A0A504ZAT5_FASGI|nr:hypothetical protein FGIG_07539 [Fasciola gigantica]